MRNAVSIVWAYAVSWALIALIASGDKDVGSLAEIFRWQNLIPVTIFAFLPFMLIMACQLSIQQWGVVAGGGVSVLAAAFLVLILNAIITSSPPVTPYQLTFSALVFTAIFLVGSLPSFFSPQA